MATYTSYLNLEKPTTSETFNLLKMNQNWDKIDAGVSALNSNCVKVLIVQKTVTIASGARINTSVPYTLPTNATFKAVLLMCTPNAAWITGSISSYGATSCDVGLYNNATSEVTGTLSVVVLYA